MLRYSWLTRWSELRNSLFRMFSRIAFWKECCFSVNLQKFQKSKFLEMIRPNALIVSQYCLLRSSRREMLRKKGVLENFTKFTEKHLCWSLFLNKIEGLSLRPATLLIKRFQHTCFPANFVKLLKRRNYFFCRTPPMATSL